MSFLRAWLLTVAVLGSPVVAESLRGEVKGQVTPEAAPVMVGLGDLVTVSLPSTTRFTKALEIEISIPRDVFPYRSNLAVFIYQNVRPGKAGDDLVGDRIGIEVLPPASKFYLEAPLVAKPGLKAAVDTAVLKLPTLGGGFPLAVSILPIDKDLPPGYQTFQFSVQSRLVDTNLGALVITTPSLSEDDRKRLKITANGVAQPGDGPLVLAPGPYALEVTLPGVDTVKLTAVVTQGKTTEVPVDLVMEPPSLVIEAPEGTQVVIDGKRIVWRPSVAFPIDLGTHNVQFVVGNTVVADSFTVTGGGRQRLTLQMAVALKKDTGP